MAENALSDNEKGNNLFLFVCRFAFFGTLIFRIQNSRRHFYDNNSSFRDKFSQIIKYKNFMKKKMRGEWKLVEASDVFELRDQNSVFSF